MPASRSGPLLRSGQNIFGYKTKKEDLLAEALANEMHMRQDDLVEDNSEYTGTQDLGRYDVGTRVRPVMKSGEAHKFHPGATEANRLSKKERNERLKKEAAAKLKRYPSTTDELIAKLKRLLLGDR